MKKIVIATPSGTGRFPAEYMDSLLRTVEAGHEKDIKFIPLFIAYDALVQRIRNDLFQMIHESDKEINEVIFIDDDMCWEPKDVFNLLSHNVDVVAGVGRKKTDEIDYPFTPLNMPMILEKNGLLEVESIGFAFIKLTRKVVNILWNNAKEYSEKHEKNRMVFNVEINKEGQLVSEDIIATRKIREFGFQVWVDPNIKIGHIGQKIFYSDFSKWMNAYNDEFLSKVK